MGPCVLTLARFPVLFWGGQVVEESTHKALVHKPRRTVPTLIRQASDGAGGGKRSKTVQKVGRLEVGRAGIGSLAAGPPLSGDGWLRAVLLFRTLCDV